MTSNTLGKPLVVKVLTAPCSGDCGGTIRVVTNIYAAYAETLDVADEFFIGGQTEVMDFEVDTRRLLVNCGSIGSRPHSSCHGHVAFEVDAFPWVAASTVPDTAFIERINRA